LTQVDSLIVQLPETEVPDKALLLTDSDGDDVGDDEQVSISFSSSVTKIG
jgi:hypothetical protein